MATDKLVDFDHVTDYISREAAWNGIYSCPTKTDADGYIWVRTKDVAHMIDEIPAADVRPVVRGKWINGNCDQCGAHAPFWCMASTYYTSNFCPNCGADMREVKADG